MEKRRQFLVIILSWHILSIMVLLIAIPFLGVTSSDSVNDFTHTGSDQATSSLLPTTAPVNSSSNDSEEANGPQAPNCTINAEEWCPENENCSSLGGECLDCIFNTSCIYGTLQTVNCTPKPSVNCTGERNFKRSYHCRYCYQLPSWLTWCNKSMECALNQPRSYYPARPFYVSTCWAHSKELCIGRRCFSKQLPCNWSQGYKWSTAMLLSIFLGGFGVDRFYLGLWREGIGKLLSFGGLGVWTLVDVILIAVGYIGPWDGSLYI
ncbi:unnamed protein product [Lymnaea stagnalis]|uniref:TM2 domain-containing protein n=1 Tax=Lymnaea stagnalis TaxID=6523 RepID=A0AAV2IJI0_LYMST